MVEVSIICLIYKSKKLAKAIYDSLYEYTPKLRSGEAELLFVANDPTVEVVKFLEKQGYPHIINVNDHLSEDELFRLGFGTPEYMRRVYQGYNQGILHAKGQKVVLINSDNFFSEDWLENLIKYSDYKKVVCSTLVEPGHNKFGVFPCAIHKNFGRTIEEYKEREFQKFASKISKTGYTSGGAYMPCLLYKDVAIMAGLYPEGNIAGKNFDEITSYGDESFYKKLKDFGVEHITAKDSIVYHLKEGEKSEGSEDISIIENKKYKYPGLIEKYTAKPTNLMNYIKPEADHLEIMEALARKFTAIILNFDNNQDLVGQINQILNQTYKNTEIIVVYDESNRSCVKKAIKGVRYVDCGKQNKDRVIYDLLYKLYGEYVLVVGKDRIYCDDMLEKVNNRDVLTYIGEDIVDRKVIFDSVENFIVPKKILLEDIGHYLGVIMGTDKIEINSEKCIIMYPRVDEIIAEPTVSSGFRSTVPYRIARKLFREGPRGVAKAVRNRVNKNQ